MLFPLLYSLIFLYPHLSLSYENPRQYLCGDTDYYTSNSSFSDNLGWALQALRNTTASTGFSTTTTGNHRVQVTALALCRATIAPSDCQQCVDAASSESLVHCWCIREEICSWKDSSTQKTRPSMAMLSAPRDIDGDSCERCLLTAIASIDSCCLGQWADTSTSSPFILVSPPATEPVVVAADKGGGGGGLVIKFRYFGSWNSCFDSSGAVCCYQWRKRDKGVKGSSGIEAKDCEEILSEDVGMDHSYMIWAFWFSATDGFLGKSDCTGGFGSVYKVYIFHFEQRDIAQGILANGEEIAVKKLAPGSTHGSKGFSNEVRLLLKLQHRNLIQLFGCCVEGEHRMLVYEYLHNKSLDYFLFDKSKSSLLDWPKRYNIILGVARGLFYLHEDSQYRIIHGDIKASNILLDKEMNPKYQILVWPSS
ncbi:Cysteine-rich receptor-like protein kinase 29 [Vitis vinifera]|uniref:non-specific serine/threonine protein kinase n=1 Tax=Vitis vinifera TaxID=29760 RepID=A0A438DA90_VITVI|nr:Cysteine-rich receptor-like protein kinase 29 [Vitis vinifera]